MYGWIGATAGADDEVYSGYWTGAGGGGGGGCATGGGWVVPLT